MGTGDLRMNECRVCGQTDLPLTANGRIRSHSADGKPCGGGSGLPAGVDTETEQPMRVTR